TGRDLAGNQTTVTVTVNLDKTPPSLSAAAPSNPVVTDLETFSFTTEVSDELSGVSDATCNTIPVTVAQGAITCDVSLRPGFNQFVLQGIDAAGNSTSRGFLIRRTVTQSATLSLTPARQTLLSGEAKSFVITDESETLVSDVVLTSSNPDVAIVSST